MSLTTLDGTPVRKPFSWSYSALDSFRTCAKKHYHEKIKKDFVEPPSEHLAWGNRVHAAMAERITAGIVLPEGMRQWEKWVDWAMTPYPRKMYVEQKMAVTNQLKPCKYFDRNVNPWFRTVADVICLNDKTARLIDWKTGKVKENSDQLSLGAAVVFAHYPEIEQVTSSFVFLKDDVKLEETFTRADIPGIWTRSLPGVIALHNAIRTDVWPPNPSGLCVQWCSVTVCPYHGKGSR